MSKNIILTSYFNTGIDPQRGVHMPTCDPRKMMLMFTAVQLGLHVVIMHDNFPEAFCARFASDLVEFHRVSAVPTERTVYTHRQFSALEYLHSHIDVDRVFCTGLFDVVPMMNPHILIDCSHQIWAAREECLIVPEERGGQWLLQELRTGYGNVPDGLHGKQLLNCDIFGGTRERMLEFLGIYCEEICKTKNSLTEMGQFNVACHLRMPANSVWYQGEPLHSRFNSFESRMDVAFLHK